MTSNASRSRNSKATLVAIGAWVIAVALGSGAAVAQVPPSGEDRSVVAAAGPNPFADRFPNVVLRTHEGKTVRLYDDLLKGKIVMINFMYATCKGR